MFNRPWALNRIITVIKHKKYSYVNSSAKLSEIFQGKFEL